MATTESSAVREFKSSVRRELLEGNLSPQGAPRPTPEAQPKLPAPARQRAARGTPSPQFNVPPLKPRPRAGLPPPFPKESPEGDAPAFANRTLPSNPPPLPRNQSPKLRDLPAPRRAQALPPPIPPPLPRAALTISLEPSKRPTVKAPSELVFPPGFDARSVHGESNPPQVDIPTLSPDRPNLHRRPAETHLGESTSTIAPIQPQRSRTSLIIAGLCVVGVLGAAGVVLYSALAGNHDGSRPAARASAAIAAGESTPAIEVAPIVTPIVEPIAVGPEASAAPMVTPVLPANAVPHRRRTPRRATQTENAARALSGDDVSGAHARSHADRKATDEAAAVTEGEEPEDVDETAEPALVEKTPAVAAPKTAPVEDGVLMLGSKPPCAIHIDGRDLGLQTPQRSIQLAAGTHKVSLINDAYNIREVFSVTIAAGEKTRVIKDLSDRLPSE